MTRQRRLKRRIRARMAKTGESYTTARREVLKRLGAAVPEQDDAPAATVPGQRRFYRAARRFLPGAALVVLVGAVVAVVVIDSGGQEGQKQPSAEQQVSAADELPVGLRGVLARSTLELDRVRSVECGAGGQGLVELPRSLRRDLVQLGKIRSRTVTRAREISRDAGKVCQTELQGGGMTVSVKVGHDWVVEIASSSRERRLLG